MTLALTLQLVKSAAIVAGAWIVLRRFSFRRYPALISWMLWEVAMQAATWGFRDLPRPLILAQDGVCLAAICEVIRESRLKARIDVQVRWLLCALAAAKILSSLPDLTSMQQWYLFRSYFLWFAFGTMLRIAYKRWRRPAPELCATRIYRAGATVWIGILAVSGSFVRSGIGRMLLPATMRTWMVLHVVTCLSVAACVLWMSIAMARSAPGRKHAAKTPKGLTRTGYVDQRMVA